MTSTDDTLTHNIDAIRAAGTALSIARHAGLCVSAEGRTQDVPFTLEVISESLKALAYLKAAELDLPDFHEFMKAFNDETGAR